MLCTHVPGAVASASFAADSARDSSVARKFFLLLVCAASILGVSGVCTAITLSFDPGNPSAALSSPLTVAARAGGVLPDGLGAYDFDVTYDPAILSFNHAVDGAGLGLALGLGTASGSGIVTVSDLSLETVADLLALQSNDFVLFSLVFDTLAQGASPLGFDNVTLSDAAANPLTPSGLGTANASVTPRTVPEPGSLALLLAGGFAATVLARRRSPARQES